MHGEGRRYCSLCALLGQQPKSAQAGRGGERIGLPGRKRGERRFSFSFSFSIISKNFQMILKPNLNLNQTTHLKNLNATA
jgi:hypothetical protein